MYRATTPTITFNIPVDLTEASEVYVTFAYQGGVLTKTSESLTITTSSVAVYLSQEETLTLPVGEVTAQINWLYEEEGAIKRACSNIIKVNISRNLIDEVLPNA